MPAQRYTVTVKGFGSTHKHEHNYYVATVNLLALIQLSLSRNVQYIL